MNYKDQFGRKFLRKTLAAYLYPDAERIALRVDEGSKKLLLRIAEECENEMLCTKTVVENGILFLLWPDYGICGDDNRIKKTLSKLFNIENYELIFMN